MFHFYLSPQAIVKDIEKEDSNYEQGSKTYLEFEEDTQYIHLNLQPFEVKVSWTKDQQPSRLEHSIIIDGAKNYGLTVTTPVALG